MAGYRGTERERLALSTLVKLVRAAGALSDELARPMAEQGLTESQFGVLETLLHLGPQQQSVLARKILRTTGNVTQVVDKLEQRGLVRRERLEGDRRCILVHLTPAGEALIGGLFPAHAARVADALDGLTPQEQRELGRLSRRLLRREA